MSVRTGSIRSPYTGPVSSHVLRGTTVSIRRSIAGIVLAVSLTLASALAPADAHAAAPSMTSSTIASGLVIPWDIGFAPDGSMFVTERPGRVRVYSSGAIGATLVRTITVPGVRAEGEAGLMGIAVDVDFAANRFVYVCASRQVAAGWRNEVLRYRVAANGSWGGLAVILSGMLAATNHNGCALEMDRFGKLWVGMGDAGVEALAQNRSSLNGKVLRINRDGSVPGDNPLIGGTRNAVYSLGHRNIQGIAIRPPTNQVYAIEHGPTVNDEVNLIAPGGNYGWPCYTGASTPNNPAGCGPASSYRAPLWASGDSTLATSGGAFVFGGQWGDYKGHLFVSTLKEQDVRRFSINAAGTTLAGPAIHFDRSFGRLRAMVVGPGDQLYATTSDGNDRVIRISSLVPVVSRLSGSDRYATAAAVSRSAFPSGASTVFVATGANFPDALAGSATAGKIGAPVLLVQAGVIPQATRTELARLKPVRIVVLGGPSVVAESVRAALRAYASSGEVTRLSGADRYGTAAAISGAYFAPGVKAAFIATGAGFADALSGAPAAALSDSPLLLVTQSGIPTATRNELSRLKPQRIYVLGGTGAVSAAVASGLDPYTTGPVTRLSGADRYATAAAIVRTFWIKSNAWVVTGLNFPDALAAGAAAGKVSVPVLLVAGTSVPLATGQEILRIGAARLPIAGGTGAVSASAAARLKILVGAP